MKQLTPEEFESVLKNVPMFGSLRRNLRFNNSTNALSEEDWAEREIVAIFTRSHNEGVLLIELESTLHCYPFSLMLSVRDKNSGRAKPIICDFCSTWQSGRNAARISFYPKPRSSNSFGHLVCGDLTCSANVRSKTKASALSRTQLHEDMTDADRVQRLRRNLTEFIRQYESYQA